MRYRIRILHTGGWVAAFDPDGGEAVYPTGTLTETRDPAKAQIFETQMAAWAAWAAQSTRTPWRPDGRPNRPMTALTVEIEPVPE